MKKIKLLFFVFLVLPVVSMAGEGGSPLMISAQDLKELAGNDAKLVIVDSRRERDYLKEHISGAVSLPAISTNADTLSELFPDLESKLVFYCQNVKCQASTIAAHRAAEVGYKHTYEFSGGIEEWKSYGYPTEKLAK